MSDVGTNASTKPPPTWPVPVLLVAALGMFGLVAMFAYDSLRLVQHGRVAIGEVIDVDYGASESGVPRVLFDADERTVSVSVANPGGRSFRVGDAVQMRFDPDRPERARFDTFFGIWGQVMIAGGVAAATVAAALVFVVLRRRALRSAG